MGYKQHKHLLLELGVAAATCCCTSMGVEPAVFDGEEISFVAEDGPLTRSMAARTSVRGFNCLVTKADNSPFISNTLTASVGQKEVLSGHYWPSSGNLSFYGVLPAVNMSGNSGVISFPVGSSAAKLDGSEDYVFASRRNVSRSTSPVSLTFNHILSNIAGVSATGGCAGTTTTINAISISHPKYGTYSCSAGGDSWTELGASEKTYLSTSFASPSHPAGSAELVGTETGASSDDISLIPGTYTVRIQYSVSSGGITREYDRSGSAYFPAGKKNTIHIAFSSDFRNLSVSTAVVPWEEGNGASAWVDDLKVPKAVHVDMNGGEWMMESNPLTSGGRYCGVYRNVDTGTTRSYKTLRITFWGYESFTFKLFVSYTGYQEQQVLVSEPDDDLFSRLPSLQTSNLYASVRAAYGNRSGDYGNYAYTGIDKAVNEAAYVDHSFTGLDPEKTYTVQVIAANCGGRPSGLNAFVIIPKEQ